MGNADSKQSQSISEILPQYHHVKRLGDGILLEDSTHQNTYFMKEFTYADQVQYEHALAAFEAINKQQPSQNVLNLVTIAKQSLNNLCSNSYKIYTVHEYPQISLNEQIFARTQQSKYFQQSQLWSILQSCANGLSEVNPALSLHPKSVFVVSDGLLKVICNELIDRQYRCIPKCGVYYAPEKIRHFQSHDTETSMRKEGVFSLGMTVLHASLLKEVSSCYKYEQLEFSQPNLEEYIEELINLKYSSQFIEVLAMILEPNPNKRASLMELHAMLNKVWNNETASNLASSNNEENLEVEDKNQFSQKKQNLPIVNHQFSKANGIYTDRQKPELPTFEHRATTDRPTLYDLPISNNMGMSFKPSDPYHQMNSKEDIYTDPKLLEMVRKDLRDINQLKKSKMFSTFSPYSQIGTSYYPYSNSYTNSYNIGHGYSQRNLHNPYPESLQYKNISPLQQESSINLGTTFKKIDGQKVSRELSRDITPYGASSQPAQSSQKLVFIKEEFEDGRYYEGYTVDGMKEGYGKLIYSDGAYYQGYFHQDQMQGKGVLYYSKDKPAYEGEWVADQFHGYGVLYNENPLPLNGQFNYSDFNMIEDFWIKYEGFFDHDNKSGEGRLILSNGQQFKGEFDNDAINGKGMFITYQENGKVHEIKGIWQQNGLIQLIGE